MGAGSSAAAPAADVQRSVLPNGLTVLSEQVPGVRSVAIGAWVRAATLHESAGEMGVSHLLEHMVFKATERRTALELSLALETLGGSLDAYTSREHTSFQARVLDEHLYEAADVLADLLFRPLLRESDLRVERKVVLEEIAMVDDTPDDLVFDIHNERLWGSNGYGYRILGTRDTVRALDASGLRALHDRAYHPGNIVVAAAGSVEHDELLETLAMTGWLDVPARAAAPLPEPEPRPEGPCYSHVGRDGAQTHIVFGSPAVAHSDPLRYAFTLASTLLGGGMSSRLFQRVREELGLAYDVHTFSSCYRRTGMHGVYVGTSPESADRAAAAVERELARMLAEGLPPDDLAAGKRQLKGQITLSLESPASRMYRAVGLELYDEPFRSIEEILALVDAITPDDVMAVCRLSFDPARQTVVSLGPEPLTAGAVAGTIAG